MLITLAIIAITCIVSFMAFKNPRLMNDLILWPPAITRQREYHRLVTYGLVHADFSHLLFNMITLFFFGRAMEPLYAQYLGVFGFALFYLGGLLVSILPSWWAHRKDPSYRSLGASGAVSFLWQAPSAPARPSIRATRTVARRKSEEALLRRFMHQLRLGSARRRSCRGLAGSCPRRCSSRRRRPCRARSTTG